MSGIVSVRRIDHASFVVGDLEASRRFYVKVLGMQEVARPAFSFGGAWFQAGDTLVHLIEVHAESTPVGSGPTVRSTRCDHLAFLVDDAKAAAKALRDAGASLLDDVKQRPDGAWQVFVQDPDGHAIELCSGP